MAVKTFALNINTVIMHDEDTRYWLLFRALVNIITKDFK